MTTYNFRTCGFSSFAGRLILDAIAKHPEFPSAFQSENGEMEIDLRVNGKEVPFFEFINLLEEKYTEMVNAQARNILSEDSKKYLDKINRMLFNIEECIKSEAHDHGFDIEHW